MSRSKKEAMCGHSGYTIETGHGGLKRNKSDMTIGAKIKPRYAESSGMTRMKAHKSGGGQGNPTQQHDTSINEKGSGDAWKKIGEAGASMVETYKSKKD